MTAKQPTFTDRIRLLDLCAVTLEARADKLEGNTLIQSELREVATTIADEAARMKLANQRWQQQRQQRQNAKNHPQGSGQR